MTLEEKSAGGVVFRRISESANQPARIEFLIGKHSGYHKWVLPKGLVERGESATETAVREVMEEVGVEAKIVDPPSGEASLTPIKTIEYYYFADLSKTIGQDATGGTSERRVDKYQEDGGGKTRMHKQVIFYLMEAEKDLGQAGWEMEERKWVTYEEGMKLLAFETEKEVLAAAGKALKCAPAET